MSTPQQEPQGKNAKGGVTPSRGTAIPEAPGERQLGGFDPQGISYASIPTNKADHAHQILFKGVIVGTREIRYLGSRDEKGRAQFQIRIIVDTDMLTSKTHFAGPRDMEHSHRFLERLFENLDPDHI